MTARPDLKAIKATAEELSYSANPSDWRMSGLLEEVISYAQQLEQDAAGLRERLTYLAVAEHNGHAAASGWTIEQCGIVVCVENRAAIGAAS